MSKIKTFLISMLIALSLTACVTFVDDDLPYDELPEITLATDVKLIASPNHPTSYLSEIAIPAGDKVALLGGDADAAWLLVRHESVLGWMPSIFSGTNVAILPQAITLEPLPEACIYLDSIFDLNDAWISTIAGDAIVIGSLYRSAPSEAFDDAELQIDIADGGYAVEADYLHTFLTEESAFILFGYSVANLHKGSSIGFFMDNAGDEPLELTVSVFSGDCQAERLTDLVPVGQIKALAPIGRDDPDVFTQDGERTEVEQAPPVVRASAGRLVAGDAASWSVRAYNLDDAGAIFVNGEMVAGGRYTSSPGDTGWVDITDYLLADEETPVVFVGMNGESGGSWGFSIRQGDTVVWGDEGKNSTAYIMQAVKVVAIQPDDAVVEIPPDLSPKRPPPGNWSVRAQSITDIGVILVNGWPVGGAFCQSRCNNPAAQRTANTDWIDISSYLSNQQDNEIAVWNWQAEGAFRHNFSLAQNGTIVWGREANGEPGSGTATSDVVTISATGEIIEQSQTSTSTSWSVRAYNLDDAGAIFVNGEMVAGGRYTSSPGDTGWVDITDYLLADEETPVVFVGMNGESGGSWGFSIRQGDTVVWGDEGKNSTAYIMQAVKVVAIQPDDAVVEIPPDLSPKRPPPGNWSVRAQSITDIGVILVNGWPVGGAFCQSRCNNPAAQRTANTDWIDISSYLSNQQDNEIAVWNWQAEGAFRHNFSLAQNGTIVWGREANGEPGSGTATSDVVTISATGEIIEQSQTSTSTSWSVRAYNLDDAGAIFVNGEMVAGGRYTSSPGDTGWVDITDYLLADEETPVVFVGMNGESGGSWGFSIRQGDTVVWGDEGKNSTAYIMQAVKVVAIQPDDAVVEIPPDLSPKRPPPGNWSVRAQSITDIGVILVNGWPVGGAFCQSRCNNPAAQRTANTDWIDISSYLSNQQDNEIAFFVWNIEGNFSFAFELNADQTTVWEYSRSGSGILGPILQYSIWLSEDGQLLEE